MYLRTVLLACCLAASASTSQTLAAPVPSTASRPAGPRGLARRAQSRSEVPDAGGVRKGDQRTRPGARQPLRLSLCSQGQGGRGQHHLPVPGQGLRRVVQDRRRAHPVQNRRLPLPQGTAPTASGGTSNCTIWYTYDNLDLASPVGVEEPQSPARQRLHRGDGPQLRGRHACPVRLGDDRLDDRHQGLAEGRGQPDPGATVEETRQGPVQDIPAVRAEQATSSRRTCQPTSATASTPGSSTWLKCNTVPNFWPDFFARIRQQREALADAVQLAR